MYVVDVKGQGSAVHLGWLHRARSSLVIMSLERCCRHIFLHTHRGLEETINIKDEGMSCKEILLCAKLFQATI